MNKVPQDHIKNLVKSLNYVYERVGNTSITGCWALLPNGFKVGYGESVSIVTEEYDENLGKRYAKERALADSINKLWFAEGYMLKNTGKISSEFNNDNTFAKMVIETNKHVGYVNFPLEDLDELVKE